MNYCLRQLISGSTGVVVLSEPEYRELKSARSRLGELYAIEENVDIAIENYCEFEIELLRIAARDAVFSEMAYALAQDTRVLLNRRFANLLSSCRMFVDHSAHHLCCVFGKASDEVAEFKELRCQIYEERIGYRLLEELRNLVQHRGHAIAVITFSAKVIDHPDDRRIRYQMIPSLAVAELAADRKFSQRVLREIESLGPKVDLRPHIRDYITDILELNEWIRRESAITWSSGETLIRDTLARFAAETSEEPTIVSLCATDESGKMVESSHLFVEILDRRHEIVRKNSTSGELRQRFVSNEI